MAEQTLLFAILYMYRHVHLIRTQASVCELRLQAARNRYDTLKAYK